MRSIVALGIFLLGMNGAAPEPEYSSLASASFHLTRGSAFPSLVEIESSTGKADRLTFAALQPHILAVEILRPGALGQPPAFASATAEADAIPATEVSRDDLCKALLTSAEDNDLPVPFFANLIWQESRLRDDAVSPKGALGIAQFMPATAAESGLDDPFDPLQAIPASARLLNELRLQFGNLGFVAAAYNAGARRVAEWLEHRRGLPRETRGYVAHVTGRSVDEWRTMPPHDAALTFVQRLPCRNLPAFADLEQAQLVQTQLEQPVAATARGARRHVAERKHAHGRHEAIRTAGNVRSGKHEAAHNPRAAHEKRRSA
jgi:hypothetical protein